MNARERSTALRMAGNIAGGLAGNPALIERLDGLAVGVEERRILIAKAAVSIALSIMADPRLEASGEVEVHGAVVPGKIDASRA